MPQGNAKGFQNLVSSTYKTPKLGLITVTWCRGLMGQGLCLEVVENSLRMELVRPWHFWKKKQGSKTFDLLITNDDEKKVRTKVVHVYWDLASAKFTGPEPGSGYYVAVVCDEKIALFLGDMEGEAMKKSRAKGGVSRPSMVSRKEHVFGKSESLSTVARFGDNDEHGHQMSITISGPGLIISVDGEKAIEVSHLTWKFRGNGTMNVGGVPVHVFWDVHDWLFNHHNTSPSGEQTHHHQGHDALFVFKSNCNASSSSSFSSADSQSMSSEFSFLLYGWKS